MVCGTVHDGRFERAVPGITASSVLPRFGRYKRRLPVCASTRPPSSPRFPFRYRGGSFRLTPSIASRQPRRTSPDSVQHHLPLFVLLLPLPCPCSPPTRKKATLNSLQLRLVATVVSEVLASPLPPLGMLKPQGQSADASFPSRHGWTPEGTTAAMGAAAGRTADASNSSAATGRAWQGMEMGMSPIPTVTSSWASKRHADWETLEVQY